MHGVGRMHRMRGVSDRRVAHGPGRRGGGRGRGLCRRGRHAPDGAGGCRWLRMRSRGPGRDGHDPRARLQPPVGENTHCALRGRAAPRRQPGTDDHCHAQRRENSKREDCQDGS
jgi:hypothetical protein